LPARFSRKEKKRGRRREGVGKRSERKREAKKESEILAEPVPARGIPPRDFREATAFDSTTAVGNGVTVRDAHFESPRP